MPVNARYRRLIWAPGSAHPGVLLRALRTLDNVVRDLADGQLSLRAMSLVYTTLLSIVPLLAVSFSVLKAFGAHEQLLPMLDSVLLPLGERGHEIAGRIVSYVENVRVGTLGALGMAFLIYTVLSLVNKIEKAFNFTWRIPKTRGLTRQFRDYLSVILIGPVLMFAALGVTATVLGSSVVHDLMAVEPFGWMLRFVGRVLPYLLVIVAFTFFYVFVPNTAVRLRSAFIGALVGGGLWESTGYLFAKLVVTSTQSTAIYSSLAILVMFMLWLYLAWLILLVGASFAYYHQYPESLSPFRGVVRLSPRVKERLVLNVLALVSHAFHGGRKPWSPAGLAQHLQMPIAAIERVVGVLASRGYLVTSGLRADVVLPAVPFETVMVADLLVELRGSGDAGQFNAGYLPESPSLRSVSDAVDAAISAALDNLSVRDLGRDLHSVLPRLSAPAVHASELPPRH